MDKEQLIQAAQADLNRIRTITRGDGSTYERRGSDGYASDGEFSVYVIPVQARTRAMREHYRVTFYYKQKRVSQAVFDQAMDRTRRNPHVTDEKPKPAKKPKLKAPRVSRSLDGFDACCEVTK